MRNEIRFCLIIILVGLMPIGFGCKDKTEESKPSVNITLSLIASGNQSDYDQLKFAGKPFFLETGRNLGRVRPNETYGFFGKVEIKGTISPSGLAADATTGLVFKQKVTYKFVRDNVVIENFTDQSDNPVNDAQQTTPTNNLIFMIDTPGITYYGYSPGNLSATTRMNLTSWVEQNGNKISNELKWHERTTLNVVNGLWTEQTPTDVGEGHISIDN